VLSGHTGSHALQRLFSTFPGGKPGIGILLLRAAVGFTAIGEGVLCFLCQSGPTVGHWILGSVLTASGAILAIGFVTPLAGICVGLCFFGIALSWLPAPVWGMQDARMIAFGVVITAIAISLLGPGAYSVDGRSFGRREIVIPPSHRPPES
jgi:uncharacterized membrane protein YphA (DoxX/SURF4 family)